MSTADDFVKRARNRREALRLSQTMLARRMTDLGYPWYQVTVARTESGARPIRLDEAAAMADLLGLAAPFGEGATVADGALAAHIAEIQEQADRSIAELTERLNQAHSRIARMDSALRAVRTIVNRGEAR